MGPVGRKKVLLPEANVSPEDDGFANVGSQESGTASKDQAVDSSKAKGVRMRLTARGRKKVFLPESNFPREDEVSMTAGPQRARAASNDQAVDDPLMRPDPVPLYPYGLGFMDVGDVTANFLVAYIIVYSVNQDDGVLRVWLNKMKAENRGLELEPPWQKYTPKAAEGIRFADLGLRRLDKTPAATALEIDTLVVPPGVTFDGLPVAVLVRTLETTAALRNREQEKGLSGA